MDNSRDFPRLVFDSAAEAAGWFASTKASATVIVLNGVTAIPDSTDFSATARRPVVCETDYTAGIQSNPQPREDNDRSW